MTQGRGGLAVPASAYVVAPDVSARARFLRICALLRARGLALTALWHRSVTRSTMFARVRPGPAGQPATANSEMRLAGRLPGPILRLWAACALLRHLVQPGLDSRDARPGSGKRTSLLLVGMGLAAALALLIPERVEPAQKASVPVPAKPATLPDGAAAVSPGIAFSLPPPPPAWQPLRQPIPMFHLEAPELAGLELAYRAARRGSSRQDNLTWTPRADQIAETHRTLAQLFIERHEAAGNTERPLFADLAARAAEQHLVVERMATPKEIRTKFGTMEAAEMTLRRDERRHACLGFRRIDMAGLTLSGWVCGTASRPVDRIALGCLVDRLHMVGGGKDPALRKLFAQAERERPTCTSVRQSGKRLTWLDHEAALPELKLPAQRR